MIRDSLRLSASSAVCTDVCIIGGGTAGILLAVLLRRRGARVVVLELGDTTSRRTQAAEFSVDQRGIHYRGATLGRSFGLGGTSVLWGGQMISVTPLDMADRPWAGSGAWPIKYRDLEPFFGEVGELLGFGNANPLPISNEQAVARKRFPWLSALGGDFTVRLSTWLPFRARNFAQEFAGPLKHDSELCVWLNAQVTSLNTSADAGHERIHSVTAVAPSGKSLEVQASAFVICAGALESTRLLLEHDDCTGGSVTKLGAPLGRYFSDHLSATCGVFDRRNPKGFISAVAPIFSGGLMQTPRLELAGNVQRARSLPSAFAHITFRTDGDTGFDVVRNFLRRRQGEQRSLRFSPQILGRVVNDVKEMAYWRFLHQRLWIPSRCEVLLQIDLEQVPNPDSRISLTVERDARGRRRVAVDWRVTAADLNALEQVRGLVASSWDRSKLRELAELRVDSERSPVTFESLYDVYHPTGTIRMGASPTDSVVDSNLRLWAVENGYVCSTAVFPSAGSANPGFTHLALAARLADHLAQRLAKKNGIVAA